jgi:hypothetical protein
LSGTAESDPGAGDSGIEFPILVKCTKGWAACAMLLPAGRISQVLADSPPHGRLAGGTIPFIRKYSTICP